jgi:hypothetical protein
MCSGTAILFYNAFLLKVIIYILGKDYLSI